MHVWGRIVAYSHPPITVTGSNKNVGKNAQNAPNTITACVSTRTRSSQSVVGNHFVSVSSCLWSLASQSIHPLREQWRNVRGKRINQSINLLGNKGPTATYKSQYTIYNDYSPRQCIQHITNHASEKAVYKLRKIQLTVQ